MRTYFRPNRIPKQSNDECVAYERAVIGAQLRAGQPPLCVHDHVAEAVRRDPALDNAARDEIQKAGQARCRAAQIAALEADPLN